MAVQAQYPSHVLLLNRNTQEGKNTTRNDYSLQQQTGGGGGASSALLDHQPPHILFNSGVGNNTTTRKRSRELISTMNTTGPTIALQQSQPPNQIINLSQLHTPQNHPNNVVSTGLRLAFGDQLQQKQHPLHHQTQQQLSLLSTQSSQESAVLLPFLSDDLDAHIKQQRQEIENFITFQGEQLRRKLSEKRRSNFKTLLNAAEESVSLKLREKEVQLEKALRCNTELEAKLAQLTSEVQAWQARASEYEATAAALQAEVQQAMQHHGGAVVAEEVVVEDVESVFIDPDRVTELSGPNVPIGLSGSNGPIGPMCRGCGRGAATMVLLPCRHLCLCTECDVVARCCPLCYSFRSSSVEVILG
ncbi:hypothetical protein Leryth_005470 [Lithospermum erythrorhizon]|nr:hypothetical protein Leryth_005470 [Lithospermum erythrorhizon]